MPTLKKQVFDICQDLAQHGWNDLLKQVTTAGNTPDPLILIQPDENALEDELLKSRGIDRLFPGFEDFALEGTQGITPSKPAYSLLYHALASPNVLWRDKQKTAQLGKFPTLEQLETVENYVFGIRPPSISFLKSLFPQKEMAIVVFANQYRTAVDTPHLKHADLIYTRTGVSRIGTAEANYDPQTRSFDPVIATDSSQTRVLPARYNVYLAVKLAGSKELLGNRFNTELQAFTNVPKDENLFFWYPIHKIFAGDECFANVGKPVSFKFAAKHTNEKIKRVHKFLIDGFDIDPGSSIQQFNLPPFKRTDMVTINANTSMALILPIVTAALVEKAVDNNQNFSTLRKSFKLPTFSPEGNRLNNFLSSLEIRAVATTGGSQPRRAPEYMHIRTAITNGAEQNLNDRRDLIAFIKGTSAYKALHYTDATGDGFITVTDVTGVPVVTKIVPAYSMVTAPDFFPFVEQSEILNQTLDDLDIWEVPPFTIADTRLLPNVSSHPELMPPAGQVWDTVTALIAGTLDINSQQTRFTDRSERRVSYLTDGAAGIFAPGWDTSFDIAIIGGQQVPHLAAYGLGSPFPEDAKLCAALSSFWPAVAPDISRSFWPENGFSRTVIPLLDSEIGAHNQTTSWDGEQGPTLRAEGTKQILRYKRLEYVDYTLNALQNKFNFHTLAGIDAKEYRTRLLKMQSVTKKTNSMFNSWLFSSYTQVDENDTHVQTANQSQGITLQATIHKFIFLHEKARKPVVNRFDLIDVEVDKEAVVLIDATEKVVVLPINQLV